MRTRQLRIGFELFPLQMWVWIVSRDDKDAQIDELVHVHWNSTHNQEGLGESKTQARSCPKRTTKFRRNLVQWEGVIRKPGHHTLNSVFRWTSQVQCLPASNVWESSDNVNTITVQFAQLFFVSHQPHGDRLAFRPRQRVVSEKGSFLRAGSFFTKRERENCNTFMTLSRPAMFRRPWSCASIAQDLTTRKQVWRPSCISHSNFRQLATLGSRRGMIPDGVSVPGRYVSAVARASFRGHIVSHSGCKLRCRRRSGDDQLSSKFLSAFLSAVRGMPFRRDRRNKAAERAAPQPL